MSREQIAEIVEFWLGPGLESPEGASDRREWWYRGGEAVDEEIRARFGDLVPRARNGEFAHWRETPDGALAMILLLDQFTRHLYRGTPEAYCGDALSFEIVDRVIDEGRDLPLHPVARIWLYHPFHHAESVVEQNRGIALLEAMRDGAPDEWRPYVVRSIEGWGRHRDIVARFGRFPHRNEVLGRSSSEEERAFLAAGAEAFGQGQRKTA